MTDNTLLDLQATSISATPPLVQAGPVYYCFHCGAQASTVTTWNEMSQHNGHNPLDGWGDHIAYLKLPCACPAETHRVAKLGLTITPLVFPHRNAYPNHHAFAKAEIAAIRLALAVIAQTTSESRSAIGRTPMTGGRHATGAPA